MYKITVRKKNESPNFNKKQKETALLEKMLSPSKKLHYFLNYVLELYVNLNNAENNIFNYTNPLQTHTGGLPKWGPCNIFLCGGNTFNYTNKNRAY